MDAKTDAKDEAIARLRRIEGQVGGIQRMLEEGRPAREVLMQIAAAEAALGETAKTILRGHVSADIAKAVRAEDELERRRRIQELIDLFARFCRLESEGRAP